MTRELGIIVRKMYQNKIDRKKILTLRDSNIITICGPLDKDINGDNRKLMMQYHDNLSKLGNLVFLPVMMDSDDFYEKKESYRIAHLHKILASNIVIFINVWKDDSYYGQGSKLEMEYARENGKLILYNYVPSYDNYEYFKSGWLMDLEKCPLYMESRQKKLNTV